MRDVRHADGAIDILRRAHLVGPALAALPALAGELLGRRGERIRHRMPDVGAAVAVEIDGVFVDTPTAGTASAPCAPPQDERMSARGVPSCSIFSACRNSLRKKSLRLPT